MKKGLFLVVAIIAMVIMLSISVSAEAPIEEWQLVSNGMGTMTASVYKDSANGGFRLEIVSVPTRPTSPITMPNNVNSKWAEYRDKITSVFVSEGTYTISSNAFADLTALKSVELREGLVRIDNNAFANCTSLVEVRFPSTVTTANGGTFRNCTSLVSVELSEKMTGIGTYMFAGCTELKSVTIPSNIRSIENNAFDGCTSLTSIVIPEGVTRVGQAVFQKCTALKEFTLPSTLTAVGNGMFRYCTSLTTVVVPDTVTSIGTYAFADCTSLNSITIGSGVATIGAYAFAGCKQLTTVYIPLNVTRVESYAFRNCKEIVFYVAASEEEVLANWHSAWNYDRCTVYYGAGNGHVHNYVRTVTKEPTHMEDGEAELYCAECEDIRIEVIDRIPHSYKSEITKEATHFEVGVRTYSCDCGYSYDVSISIIPHSYVSEITREATHLQAGIITYVCSCGESYTETIEKIATHTYVVTTVKEATHKDFGTDKYSCDCGYSYNTATERVPHNFVDGVCECGEIWVENLVQMWNISRTVYDDVAAFLYEDAENPGCYRIEILGSGNMWWNKIPWSSYRNTITSVEINVENDNGYTLQSGAFSGFTALKSVKIGEGLKVIAPNAFRDCRALETVELPSSLMSIESLAFSNCNMLKGVYGLKKVEKVGDRAFQNCVMLESIDGLENVYYYGNGVFANCQSLRRIVFGYEIHELRPNLFENCRALETVIILGNVRQIPEKAFYRCTSLYNVVINNIAPIEDIGRSAFEGCSNLKVLSFAGGVYSIGQNAFRGCNTLVGIDLGSCLKTIEAFAFADCRSLTEIKLPSSLCEIGEKIFQGCYRLTVYTEIGMELKMVDTIKSMAGRPVYEDCEHIHFDEKNTNNCKNHTHSNTQWNRYYFIEPDHYTMGVLVEHCGCGAARVGVEEKIEKHDLTCTVVSGSEHRATCPCGLDETVEHDFANNKCSSCGYVRNVLVREDLIIYGISVPDSYPYNEEMLTGANIELLYNGIVGNNDLVNVGGFTKLSILNGFCVDPSVVKTIAIYTRAKIHGEVSCYIEEVDGYEGDKTLVIHINYVEVERDFYDTPQPIYFEVENFDFDRVQVLFECADNPYFELEISEIQFICQERSVDVSKDEERNEIIFTPIIPNEQENFVEVVIGADAMDGLDEADTVRIETIFGSIALDEMAKHKISSEDGIKVIVEKKGVDKSGKVEYNVSICDKDGNPLMPPSTVDENGEFVVQLQFKKGKNKDDIKIRYKGTDGKGNTVYEYKDILDYDPVTGIVTFKTKHFSDYEIFDVNEDMSCIVDRLFEFKGYSLCKTSAAICYGFDINYQVAEEYKQITGADLEFGVLFAAESLLEGKMPLDENGEAISLENGRVAQASLTGYDFQEYCFHISDITDDLADENFVVSAYAVTNSGVVYYQENGMSKEVSGISYNAMLERVAEEQLDM